MEEITTLAVRKSKPNNGGKWRVEACFGPNSIYWGSDPIVLNSHKWQRDSVVAAHALGRFLGVPVVVYTQSGSIKSRKDHEPEGQ